MDRDKSGTVLRPTLHEAGVAHVEELEDHGAIGKAYSANPRGGQKEDEREEGQKSTPALEEGKVQSGKKRRKAGEALRDRDPWD